MRIFDCFCFFQELDILEIRLSELDPIVDHFVIVESRRTFKNHEKPLHFPNNLKRFERWLDKIRYFSFDAFDNTAAARSISSWKKPSDDNWAREWLQREALGAGVFDAAPDDLIMISDLDEIPERVALQDTIDKKIHKNSILFFENKLYFNKLNWFTGNYAWLGTRIIEKKNFVSAQHLKLAPHKGNVRNFELLSTIDWRFRICRNFRSPLQPRRIPNAGWHFSAVGTIKEIEAKAATLIDPIEGIDFLMKSENISANIAAGRNYYGGPINRVDIETLPRAVSENVEKYSRLLDLEPTREQGNLPHG